MASNPPENLEKTRGRRNENDQKACLWTPKRQPLPTVLLPDIISNDRGEKLPLAAVRPCEPGQVLTEAALSVVLSGVVGGSFPPLFFEWPQFCPAPKRALSPLSFFPRPSSPHTPASCLTPPAVN